MFKIVNLLFFSAIINFTLQIVWGIFTVFFPNHNYDFNSTVITNLFFLSVFVLLIFNSFFKQSEYASTTFFVFLALNIKIVTSTYFSVRFLEYPYHIELIHNILLLIFFIILLFHSRSKQAIRLPWAKLKLLKYYFTTIALTLIFTIIAMFIGFEHKLGGFMIPFKFGNFLSISKTYRSGDSTVILLPMMHIAESSFYEKILPSFEDNALILLEGVKDSKKIVSNKLDYSPIAHTMGLTSQGEFFNETHFNKLSGKNLTLKYADVETSDLSSNSLSVINDLSTLLAEKPFSIKKYNSIQQQLAEPLAIKNFFNDILIKRNDQLWENFEVNIEEYSTIVIPWGAYHMPDLEKRLFNKGYRFIEKKERVVFNYIKLIKSQFKKVNP